MPVVKSIVGGIISSFLHEKEIIPNARTKNKMLFLNAMFIIGLLLVNVKWNGQVNDYVSSNIVDAVFLKS